MKSSSLLICVSRLRSALLVALTGAAALAQAAPGDTELVSVAPDGKAAGLSTQPTAISSDGRYVVFNSDAPVFRPGATERIPNVFVRDRQNGTTELVSVDSAGMYDTIGCENGAAISSDGRYVAFACSSALVPGDTNGSLDVYLRDRQAGTTQRISVSSTGTQGNSDSLVPAMSPDGRYVAFQSFASNLVAGDTNAAADVFVRDRQTGTTQRVSLSSTGVQGNGNSFLPSISADGRYVAFESSAANLVANDANGASDAFVRDRQTGTTQLVSLDTSGQQILSDSFGASISADGRYVAFDQDVAFDATGQVQPGRVFVRDRQAASTELVSVNSAGTPANFNSHLSSAASISGDGRNVAFMSVGTNLVPDDTNNAQDVFVHDRQSGVTQRINVRSDGSQGDTGGGGGHLSTDGRFVAFRSQDQLVENDQNTGLDAYVHEMGAPVVAPFTLVPGTVDFGRQPWGAALAGRGIQLTNTGSATLSIQAIELTGQNPRQFELTSHCGASLTAGASCEIDVVFHPTSVGVKTASLNVQTNAGSKSTTLRGEGVSTAFALSPTFIDFGNQAVGTLSTRRSVRVSNLGTVTLPIYGITMGGTNPGQFGSITSCGSTVPVGGSCEILVRFKPTRIGTQTATLTVKVAGGAKDKSVNLTGKGT